MTKYFRIILAIGYHAQRGFSLIETLFALFVLTMAAVSGFAVLTQSIRVSPASRQEIIAANLAQEAIELVRGIRDERLLLIADELADGQNPLREWARDLRHCGAAGVDSYQTHLQLTDKDDITSAWSMPNCGANPARFNVSMHQPTAYYATIGMGGPANPNWQDTGFRRRLEIAKYVCGNPPTCTTKTRDDSCTANCIEVRVKVKVYWNTDIEPATCPSENCVFLEDRLTGWVDFVEYIL